MAKNGIRIPPQHIDSEKALLGSIMLRPESMYEIIDVISADSFYSEKHKIIYRAMTDLFAKSEPIDMLSLSAKLEEKSQLESVGGRSYITELVQFVPSSANIMHYAKIVQKKHLMRRLIEASENISNMGYNEEEDLEYLLDSAEKRIYEVTNFSNVHRFKELKNALGEAWERIDKLHKHKDGLRGVPTGFGSLDNLLSGFQNSDLIILAARPSVGKTALVLDIARKVAVDHNIPVGIFSLEMSAQQLVDRMLAAESRVDAWQMRTGKLTAEEDFGRIRDALGKLSSAPIFIDDQPGNNILKMRSVARRLKSEKGLGLIVVDYLQLMAPVQTKSADSLVQQVTEISRSLKHLARELDVPVIALSQLSRAVEQRGGKPRLSDLRDSGSIEQDADVVMFIHREREEDGNKTGKSNQTEILVEKHRNGPVGMVKLYFDDKKLSFLEVEKSDFGDFAGAM